MTEEGGAPAEVVGAFLSALRARDFPAARALWTDDGLWHITGSHEAAGDYGVEDYLALLRDWYQRYPDYQATATSLRSEGREGVALHLTSRNGPAPGDASGWMLYRVSGSKINEGWGIPTFAGGTSPF